MSICGSSFLWCKMKPSSKWNKSTGLLWIIQQCFGISSSMRIKTELSIVTRDFIESLHRMSAYGILSQFHRIRLISTMWSNTLISMSFRKNLSHIWWSGVRHRTFFCGITVDHSMNTSIDPTPVYYNSIGLSASIIFTVSVPRNHTCWCSHLATEHALAWVPTPYLHWNCLWWLEFKWITNTHGRNIVSAI